MKITVQKTANVQDPGRAHDTDAVLDLCVPEGQEEKNDRIYLTVGGLMRELQEIAFRHGNDTPIVVPTTTDADYEQAVAPIVMHAEREPVPGGWALFRVAPNAEAVAVIM